MHDYPLIEKLKNEMNNNHPYPLIIAGPCAVENLDDMLSYAENMKKHNVSYIRSSLFKPRTSPHDFQGLHDEGIKILKQIKDQYDLKLVCEITAIDQISLLSPVIDVFQVGARSMQNFELLKELGKTNKTILLKRGFGNTIDEWLGACEYILEQGNKNIILCERGIRSFDNTLRNTLDLSGAILVKKLTNLPVIIDPSHATGSRDLIEPLCLASIAAGLDGFIVEVHKDPNHALSDGMQSITIDNFNEILNKVNKILQVL